MGLLNYDKLINISSYDRTNDIMLSLLAYYLLKELFYEET